MRLFKLIPDNTNYQSAGPGFGMEAWIALSRQMVDFEPTGSRWAPGLFQWTDAGRPRGTFFSLIDPTLIGVTDGARRSPKLWAELERCGEFLPITIEGYGQAYAYRILVSGGALDEQNTRFIKLSNGKRAAVKAAFDPSAFHEDGLVRVKDAPLVPLCVQELKSSIIYSEYTRCEMTGLIFDCLHAR